jgi:hypothetical protein
MPGPARPTSTLDWTIGNPNFGTVTVEPTSGKKTTGWTPSEKPPAETWNWLLYNSDAWIKYLTYQTDELTTQVTTLLSSLTANMPVHETPVGAVDDVNVTFTLAYPPVNAASVWFMVDGRVLQSSEFGLVSSTITLAVAPSVGQEIDCIYLRAINVVPGGGGGGGSQAYVPNGSVASPVTVAAAVGVPVLTADRQMIFVKSVGGAVAITANPQVAPAVGVGQELIVIGTSDTNYISLADGNGLALNGGIDVKANRTITLVWTGAVWLEMGRR